MPFRYAVIGAGRQGLAAAYDLARHGDAAAIVLIDADGARLGEAAAALARLAPDARVETRVADAADERALACALDGANAALSAVPYFLNEGVTRAAIAARASVCDLGGNTDVVRAQLALDGEARAARVRVVPDCGLAPGMATTFAVHATSLLDDPREVRIYCGGLPERPAGPLGYALLFSIHGLVNEYTGEAVVLRDGRVERVPVFAEREEVETPLGRLEAFTTSGGTSTAPWTFAGRLDRYEYKTLRRPGHYDRVRAMIDLGLLAAEPVRVGDAQVRPRDVFCAVVGPRLDRGRVRDVVVLRVVARGGKGEVVIDLVDRYDEATGLSATERTTGFAAAIVCAMLARGGAPAGASPLEQAIDAARFLEEIRRRGFDVRVSGP